MNSGVGDSSCFYLSAGARRHHWHVLLFASVLLLEVGFSSSFTLTTRRSRTARISLLKPPESSRCVTGRRSGALLLPALKRTSFAATPLFASPEREGGRASTSPSDPSSSPPTTFASPTAKQLKQGAAALLLSCSLLFSQLGFPGTVAMAYEESDYASDTVQAAIQAVKNAQGNVDDSLKAYEKIESIITEGTGVGGSINFKGVQLERGFVSDEDTSIYNPGLTLLTESEKERIVDALVQSRKAGLDQQHWSENTQIAFDFLRGQLDPLHMHELRGYLAVFPFVTAVVYLAVLGAQQLLPRGLFPVAYFVGVAIIILPAAALIALGT